MNSKVILYTIGCPKCKVLELKLKQKNVQYSIVDDMDIMKEKNMLSLPILEVDGTIYNFSEAIKFLNSIEV